MGVALPVAQPRGKVPFYRLLYVQVLAAIVAGILLGHFYPDIGTALKPLGDAFIKLVKMIIAPVIFLTVATGIAGMSDLQKVGRVAGKAMLYFLVFSTLALGGRPAGRQRHAARRRHAYRSGDAGCQGRGNLRCEGS